MRFTQSPTWSVRTSTPRPSRWRIGAQTTRKVVATVETSSELPLERGTETVEVTSVTTSPLSNFADQIFAEGAESLKLTTSKSLKINRDLTLYRARRCRQRGKNASRKFREMHFQKAEKCYREVIEMDPTDCRAYVGLGRLMEEQRRYDEARVVYEDGCAVSAGMNAHLWTSRGNLEMKMKNVDRAREFFDAAINADRSHAAAWHAWGLLEKSQGNYKGARDYWRKGIRHAKGTPSQYFHQSLADLASELERYDEAQHWYREGTKTTKGAKSWVLWSSWALMEGKRGNVTLMRELYGKSLDIQPNGRYSYLSWGRFEQDRGFLHQARVLYVKGFELNPNDPAYLNALAMLELECKSADRAREYFKQSVELDPNYQYSWQAWGVLEAHERNYDKARRLFQQGVWANPKSKSIPIIFQAWGRMEERAGNVDVARALYKYGLKADPKSEALWDAWIRLEESQENFVKAKELRNDFMQKRVEFALPKDFSMLDESYGFAEEFFTQFSDWLTGRGGGSSK